MTAHPRPLSQLTSAARGEFDDTTAEHRVVAVTSIRPGDRVATFGGVLLSFTDLLRASGGEGLDPGLARIALQVDEDQYLVSTEVAPADWINHSCEPNTGLRGRYELVALRSIAPGEEISFDYATSDGSPYDEFDCRCGSALCRGRVQGSDWSRPELWTRYHGHFSPYLARRIRRVQLQTGVEGERRGVPLR